MSTNFQDNIINGNRRGALFHTKASHMPHQHMVEETDDGMLMNKKVSASTVVNQNAEDLLFTTSSSTAAVFGSDGISVDVRIPVAGVHYVKECVMQLSLTNGGGAPITFVSIPNLIDFVEIFLQDANLRVARYPGHYLRLQWEYMLNRGQTDALNKTIDGLTTTTTLGAGVSRRFHYPIITWLTQCQPFVAGLQHDMLIRVHFRGGLGNIVTAGANVPTMDNFGIILRNMEVPKPMYNKLIQQYKEETHDFPCHDVIQQSFTTTLAASTDYTFVLSGLTGLAPFMFINIRSSTVGTGVYTYQALDSFLLEDSSGRTICGLNTVYADYNEGVQYPSLFKGLKPTANQYFWSHGEAPEHVWSSGSNLGYYAYDGRERLRITTPSGLVGGSYTIEVLADVYHMIRVKDGKSSFIKS